jgi:hypothetical protein
MKFIDHNLGRQDAGTIVEITLSGNAANVRLLDSSNFSSYKAGRRHTFIGGLATRSPVRFQIPRSGHWHVTVDMMGLRGNVRSSARILPGALSPIRQGRLPSLAPLVQNSVDGGQYDGAEVPEKEYDVFISHATEDKEPVARPLAHALRDAGLRVWYDEFELRIGDSLRRKIDKGLANSRFGVVVLSHSFIDKNWPQYELDGLVTREMTGQQIILPLWHNISRLELVKISPSLADKLARSTSDFTIEEIATEIASVIHGEEEEEG